MDVRVFPGLRVLSQKKHGHLTVPYWELKICKNKGTRVLFQSQNMSVEGNYSVLNLQILKYEIHGCMGM